MGPHLGEAHHSPKRDRGVKATPAAARHVVLARTRPQRSGSACLVSQIAILQSAVSWHWRILSVSSSSLLFWKGTQNVNALCFLTPRFGTFATRASGRLNISRRLRVAQLLLPIGQLKDGWTTPPDKSSGVLHADGKIRGTYFHWCSSARGMAAVQPATMPRLWQHALL